MSFSVKSSHRFVNPNAVDTSSNTTSYTTTSFGSTRSSSSSTRAPSVGPSSYTSSSNNKNNSYSKDESQVKVGSDKGIAMRSSNMAMEDFY